MTSHIILLTICSSSIKLFKVENSSEFLPKSAMMLVPMIEIGFIEKKIKKKSIF